VGLWVVIGNAYVAVLPAERHSMWASCLLFSQYFVVTTGCAGSVMILNQP